MLFMNKRNALLAFLFISLVGCRLKKDDLFSPNGVFDSHFVGPLAFARFTILDISNTPELVDKDSCVTYINDSEQNIVAKGSYTNDSVLSPKTYQVFDTISFGEDLFKKLESGTYKLSDTKVGISATNGLGLPVDLVIKRIYTVNAKTGQEVNLISAINKITVSTATKNPFAAKTDSVVFSNINSNVNLLGENLPRYLYFEGELKTKPNANSWSSPENFAKSRMWVEIPLNINIMNMKYVDTIEANLNIDSNEIDNGVGDGVSFSFVDGIIKVKISNQNPVNIATYVYFLDQSGAILDSLHTTNLGFQVPTAELGANGRTTNAGLFQQDIHISPEKAKRLNRMRSISYSVYTNTYQTNLNRIVKLYSDYKIDIRLIGDLKTKTKMGSK